MDPDVQFGFLHSSSSFLISFTFNSGAGLSVGAIWFLCSGSCEYVLASHARLYW
jgi:hypothetical protein